jgi:hypothetical protein
MKLAGDLSELLQHEYDHLEVIFAVSRAPLLCGTRNVTCNRTVAQIAPAVSLLFLILKETPGAPMFIAGQAHSDSVRRRERNHG